MCLGTHDVSLITLDDGIIEVKATGGNTRLGYDGNTSRQLLVC
jgi:molecular chaperone DnaK (HSP70)